MLWIVVLLFCMLYNLCGSVCVCTVWCIDFKAVMKVINCVNQVNAWLVDTLLWLQSQCYSSVNIVLPQGLKLFQITHYDCFHWQRAVLYLLICYQWATHTWMRMELLKMQIERTYTQYRSIGCSGAHYISCRIKFARIRDLSSYIKSWSDQLGWTITKKERIY